ncbi:MAG: hypothetical protein INQ03_25265 [Candidatus Heimdallarchaeota archaeon]|nr:hypothetical protein [Candidatus Heimdallarchaeota archaeon]
MVDYATFFQVLAFPVIVLVLWSLIFNSKNSRFTKFFIEGGYVFVVIPMMVLTFLTVPFFAVGFWLNSTDYSKEIVQLFIVIVIFATIIVEYYYGKKVISNIEEREQMPILQIIKRELDPEYRKQMKELRKERAEESGTYFDEITRMNERKRKLDLEKKEKLKKALLNEYE